MARKKAQSTSTKPARINQKQKERQALALRQAGATYDDIAKSVGYNDASAARKAVVRVMNALVTEPAEELRTIQYERYNMMLVTLWPDVQQGDPTAINTALRVMGDINNMMGVLAPSKVEVDHHHEGAVLVVDGSPEDYINALRQARGETLVDGANPSRGLGELPVPQLQAPGDSPAPTPTPTHPSTEDDDDVLEAEVIDDDD